MDRRRAGWALAALVVAGVAAAATQGPPAYVYTGAAPSGACTGTRVWIDALGSGTYYCNAGTWAPITLGNASTATALATNPTDCGAGTKATAIDASGNLTCSAVAVADLSATGTPSSATYLRGDGTWSAPPGGSGGGNFVAVDVDFGATGSEMASVTVVGQAWVTATSRIACSPTMHLTTSREEGAEDAVVERLTVAVHSRVAGTGFTVTASPDEAPALGVYQFACTGGDGGSAGVLTAWVSSTSATGLCSTSSGNCTATSLSRTCSATGGSGTYTYAWAHVAGSSATAVNPSSASTTFQRNAAAGADPGTDYTGTMRCTVTDTGTGGTATAEVVYTSTHVIVI